MPKQKQEIDKVHVLMPRDMHRRLKAKLALKGQSLSAWFREKSILELGYVISTSELRKLRSRK